MASPVFARPSAATRPPRAPRRRLRGIEPLESRNLLAVLGLGIELRNNDLERIEEGAALLYHYDTRGEGTGITRLLQALAREGLSLRDIETRQSSLEEIFVGLVREGAA